MSFARRFLLILFLGSFVPHAQAVTLDWDGVTWTAGSLSNSYDIDPVRPGNDITVTVSGNTTLLQPGSCVLAAALILRHSAKFRK